MTTERITYLQKQYLLNSLTLSEREELRAALADPDYRASFADFAETKWNEPGSDVPVMDTERAAEIYGHVVAQAQSKRPQRLWKYASIAAAVAAITVGVWFYNSESPEINSGQASDVVYKNDVAPGKQGATLTLASGERIKLTDAANGEIAKEGGVSITKAANGQLVYEIVETASEKNGTNRLNTDNGETYQVRLPDGSLVWLNAASSLEYPANFTALKQRRVKLTGEGYFQVAKDKAHPFIVATTKQEVEVLGTHFNVNAYADESSVVTTLLEGSVEVTTDKLQKILKPGEQALNNGDVIEIGKANLDNITDWKDGDFYLDRVDFRTAMRKIARWYDVEIIYDASVPEGIESGGWISRNNTISTVLKLIEKTGQVHFKVEGRKVYVTK